MIPYDTDTYTKALLQTKYDVFAWHCAHPYLNYEFHLEDYKRQDSIHMT